MDGFFSWRKNNRRLAALMVPVGMDLTPLLQGPENKRARFRTLLIFWDELDKRNIPISHSLDLYSINRRMTRRCSHKLLQKNLQRKVNRQSKQEDKKRC